MSMQHKIHRTANAPTSPPDETETAVAQALIDLENSVPDLKMELRPLQISAAREVDVRGGKKAIVVFVPVPQLKAFHKVQARYVLSWSCRPAQSAYSHRISFLRINFRLTRELEKKFSDRHVVFVAQRRILRKPTRTSRVKQKRPRSRTLTDVHEKILEDLVFPTEIVGKRTRVNQDGSKLLKVWVPADLPSISYYHCYYPNLVFSGYMVNGTGANQVLLSELLPGFWTPRTLRHWSTSLTRFRPFIAD
jgi:small subunit ribosomal protein S7e